MTIRSPLILGLAALVLAACAMVGSVNTPTPTDAAARLSPRPGFHCALRLTQTNGQIAVEARVQSPDTLTGTYALRLAGVDGGTMIQQSGDFLSAGQVPAVLGTATLGGTANDYATTLTIRTGGQVYACPVERR